MGDMVRCGFDLLREALFFCREGGSFLLPSFSQICLLDRDQLRVKLWISMGCVFINTGRPLGGTPPFGAHAYGIQACRTMWAWLTCVHKHTHL